MLPKSRRLSSLRDFQAFRRGSRVRRGRYLDLRVRTTEQPKARFGFIVNKRVAKHATKRNQVKRRLRHIVADLPAQHIRGIEALVIAKSGAAEQTSQTLANEIRSLLIQSPRATRSH